MTPYDLLELGIDANFPTDAPVPEPAEMPEAPPCPEPCPPHPCGPPDVLYNLARIVRGAKGDPGTDGLNGANGTDGFSPQIQVLETAGGHEVTVVDRYGTQSFIVDDGDDYVLTMVDKEEIAGLVLPPMERITNMELEQMLR